MEKLKLTEEIVAQLKAVFDTDAVKETISATEKAVDAESGTFEVIITTENIDRYNEVIKLDGWDLTHYKNNPVVLWGHDHHLLPIGVATSVEPSDGKLIAKGKFASHEHAQEIRKLYDMGIVRATSVGFIEKEREGNMITKAELIEFSFVSVPANPYALSLAMEKEININELVTKGFMNLKEAEPIAEVVVEEEPEPVAVEEAPVVEEVPAEEKSFNTKAVVPILSQLKEAVIALEALTIEEPERKEDEEPVVVTEDEKALAAFEQKKVVQEAATILGAVLAEWRQREQA